MSEVLLRPGSKLGVYPQKDAPYPSGLRTFGCYLKNMLPNRQGIQSADFKTFYRKLLDEEKHLESLDDSAFNLYIADLRRSLSSQGLTEDLSAKAFALVREAANRTLGMRHYKEQVFGGWIMLNGMLAEMDTGEGKTLTATLPLCAAALAGVPVHLITANEYLAKRDAELMRPLYEKLGLSVDVADEHRADPDKLRKAYASQITYCTSKQVTFDYLKDQISLRTQGGQISQQLNKLNQTQDHGRPVLLRGLCFAIVDEADSILIDEARTPLILSKEVKSQIPDCVYTEALDLSGQLLESNDFLIHSQQRSIELTEAGKQALAEACKLKSGIWKRPRQRNELIKQALSAEHLFTRDQDYLVKDDKIQIIDSNTGRTMPDRSWELGLHQMIETRENCPISPPKETLARISYQRFFRRYLRLAGMTGTAKEVATELDSTYGLKVIRVPNHKTNQRKALPQKVRPSKNEKWQTIAAITQTLHQQGRPVLIGTRSVEASEHISQALKSAGLPHAVLNARQDKQEAHIIANAGKAGQITVATNMAGRGTDIKLSKKAKKSGGLHVIAAEQNDSRRIDRQLFGRCARQGDPGSYQIILSFNDEILNICEIKPLIGLIKAICSHSRHRTFVIGTFIQAVSQRLIERRHAKARQQLLKLEKNLEEKLAFAGQQK